MAEADQSARKCPSHVLCACAQSVQPSVGHLSGCAHSAPPHDCNDFQRVILFDGLYLLVPLHPFKLLVALVQLLVNLYNNHVLFFETNPRLNHLLEGIVLHCNDRFFFNGSKHERKTICHKVRKYFLFLLNLFQSLLVINSKSHCCATTPAKVIHLFI